MTGECLVLTIDELVKLRDLAKEKGLFATADRITERIEKEKSQAPKTYSVAEKMEFIRRHGE